MKMYKATKGKVWGNDVIVYVYTKQCTYKYISFCIETVATPYIKYNVDIDVGILRANCIFIYIKEEKVILFLLLGVSRIFDEFD